MLDPQTAARSPRTLLGKSSISYLDETDWSKPKRQTYKTYVDSFIEV